MITEESVQIELTPGLTSHVKYVWQYREEDADNNPCTWSNWRQPDDAEYASKDDAWCAVMDASVGICVSNGRANTEFRVLEIVVVQDVEAVGVDTPRYMNKS